MRTTLLELKFNQENNFYIYSSLAYPFFRENWKLLSVAIKVR